MSGVRTIMFVCHGNINRSPAGELTLRRMLASASNELSHLEIRSCGTNTPGFRGGAVMAAAMRREMASRGYPDRDLKRRSVQLRREEVNWADLILYMDDKNGSRILEIATGRVGSMPPGASGPSGSRGRGSGLGSPSIGYFAAVLNAPPTGKSYLVPLAASGGVARPTPRREPASGKFASSGARAADAGARRFPTTEKLETAPGGSAGPDAPVEHKMLKLSLLLDPPQAKIPDPHYDKTHQRAVDMVEEGCERLIQLLASAARRRAMDPNAGAIDAVGVDVEPQELEDPQELMDDVPDEKELQELDPDLDDE